MDDEVTIEDAAQWAQNVALQLAQELKGEKYCHLDLDEDSFFRKGSVERKVYTFQSPKSSLSKSQKQKLRKKTRKEKKDLDRIRISFSDPSTFVGARKYILDSGASFHLADPETLTEEERKSIEKCAAITLETANGEVVVDRRCLIYVKELDVQVWAFLHKDTVCVLSLGLIVDRAGFTFAWQPGKSPTLTKGKLKVTTQPNFNVPFIYASKYLEVRKAFRAGGNPVALPSSASKDKEVQEEMKELLEDNAFDQALDPQPDDDEESDCPPGISGSSDDESPPPLKPEATPRRRRKKPSRP